MGDIAAILIDKSVVKIKNFDNLRYTLDGFLYGFTVNNLNYVHCVESDVIKANSEMFQQSIPKGYYDESKFLEYRKDKNKIKEFLESKYDVNFVTAIIGDLVHVKKIKLTPPYTDTDNSGTDDFGFWLSYTLAYNGISLLNNNGSIINPSSTIPEENMNLEQISKEFYNANIHYATKIGLSDAEKYDRALIIAKIAININNITRIVFPLFTGETLFEQIKTSQNELWKTDVFINSLQEDLQEDLQKYLNGTSNFSRVGRLNKLKIELASGTEKLYWLVIGMPISALSILTALSKLKLLEFIIRNVTIRETYFFNNDNEALVLRIVKSVTESQGDEFLTGLIDETKYSSLNSWSLFNRLLNDVDDSFIGIGEDNRKDLVMSLYLIWQVSSYNPYQNGTFSQTNLNKFVYNDQLGTNPDPSKPIFESLMGINPQSLKYSAAPITLNYVSETAYGFYFDNFDFYNTAPAVDGDSFSYDMRHFLNGKNYPKNKIIAIQDNYKASGDKGLYGTYDYYQPVSLINTNQNAAISIPVVNGNNNPIDNNINSLIPIFVLKYIDGKNRESNFKTGVGYFVDVASLFLGGYGALTKIKHLRALSGFTEAMILGTETGSGTGLVVSMYVAAGTEAISFSAATISLFLKIITTPGNANKPWLVDLKNKVMWLEILSATSSALAEGMIRKTSKNLVNEFNNTPNGWPDEFISDPRGIDAQLTLQKTSGLAVDITIYRNKALVKLEKKFVLDTKYFDGDRYTLSEKQNLIDIGYQKGLTSDEASGIIHQASRRQHPQVDVNILHDRMDNLLLVKRRGYPFPFTSKVQFQNYIDAKIKPTLDKFGLPKNNVHIGGSGITSQTSISGGIQDTDWVVYFASKEEESDYVNELVKKFEQMTKTDPKILNNKKARKYIEGLRENYLDTGTIHKQYIVAIENGKKINLFKDESKVENYIVDFFGDTPTDITPKVFGINNNIPQIKINLK
nr:hypothetical protein [uncultured Flavobacterium sp.]